MPKVAKDIKIITVICIFIILLRAILHYSELGFFEFILFFLIPKWWLLFIPTVILFIKFFDKKLTYTIFVDFIVTAASIYIIYYVLTPDNLDNFDWKSNYKKRQKIVELAKEKKLEHVRGRTFKFPKSLTLFPFIKSNTVAIDHQIDTSLTITFYTDTGINDHYSGFVYSNDSTQIKILNDKVKLGGNDLKKEENWYFIHD